MAYETILTDKQGKIGFAYTKNLRNIDELIQHALDSMKGGVAAEFDFPSTEKVQALNTYDPGIKEIDNAKIVEECKRIYCFMENKIEELRAGLVVLCPALIPREDNRLLADVFGLELDDHGFFKTKDPLLTPVETDVEGVFVCGYCQAPKDISESVTQASAAAARAAEIHLSAVVGR